MCDNKRGEWDLGLQNATFRVCRAISIYDLVVKMKSAVYRCTKEASNPKDPEVLHDLSSNYSPNMQDNLSRAVKEIEFFRALAYFVREF